VQPSLGFFSCFLYTHTYIHRYTRGLALLLFNEVLSQEEMTRKDKMRTVGVAIEMLSALAFLVHVGRESDKELSMNVRDVARAQEILLQKRKSNSSTEKYVMKAADVVVKMMSSTGESHLLTGSRDSCEFSHIVWEEFLCANHIVDDLLCVSVHDATKRIQHYVGDHDAMLKISTESSSASLKGMLPNASPPGQSRNVYDFESRLQELKYGSLFCSRWFRDVLYHVTSLLSIRSKKLLQVLVDTLWQKHCEVDSTYFSLTLSSIFLFENILLYTSSKVRVQAVWSYIKYCCDPGARLCLCS